MKNKILTIILLFLSTAVFAQFDGFYTEGLNYQQKEQYYLAIKSYRTAIMFTNNKQEKAKAQKQIDFCANKLNQLRIEAEKQKKLAVLEKNKADSLLKVSQDALAFAVKMREKVETAMFDKAVKEQFDDWKGYANYDWTDKYDDNTKKGLEILNKIDSLDLSNNALLRLPKEVAECKNLKHINLLGNPDIDWQDCFTKVKATGINSVYVSVNDLSDIDSSYWHLITGIEILENGLQKIPENILQRKQLTYLDLSTEYSYKNKFSTLPPKLFELTNLKYLILNFCSIDSLPQEIGNLTTLTELNLEDNPLSSLPPEIGNLTNLTELDLYDNNLSSLPKEIGNLKNLTELDLSYNYQFSSLPPEIGNLTNLTELDLGGNQLKRLPPEIGNLTNLTYLNLYGNKLSTLPKQIGNLTNLNILVLKDNKLSSLPPEIGNLKNLTELNLRWNKLSSLPPQIGNLTNLTELDLSNNYFLSSLPPQIGNLTNLTELDLYDNNLSSLPKEIGNLTNLNRFNLNSNQLSSLPKEIGNLTNLTELYLDYNKLISLPLQIGNLKNLTWLNLGHNQLSSLPPEIGNLKNLTELNLRWNKLSSLPPQIGNLTNLTKLNLYDNDSLDIASVCNAFANFSKKIIISSVEYENNDDNSKLLIIIPEQNSLPKKIGNLTNLTELNLYDNDSLDIASVCNAFANYPKEIIISTNKNSDDYDNSKLLIIIPKQSSLPPQIGNLTNLTKLNLYDNDSLDIASVCNAFANYPKEIIISTYEYADNDDNSKLLIIIPNQSSLPKEIGNLKNLTELDLRYNQLSSLPPQIGNLTNLTYLNLYGNKLSSLPKEIGNLKNLTELFLYKNQLSSLPSQIGNLTNLTELDLSSNELSSLPPEIRNLKKLKELDLRHNNFSQEEKQKIEKWFEGTGCKIYWYW